MSVKPNVLVRVGFSDIVISKEENGKMPNYIPIKDEDGNPIGECQPYLVGYELEDGSECDEDGNTY